MSARPVVDSADFARRGSTLSGEVPVAELARLREAVSEYTGRVAYTLSGLVDAQGKPTLRLVVKAQLTVRCQRCLAPLEWTVESDRWFVLVENPDTAADILEEGDAVEHILADPHLAVLDLVEEEVLLGLPIAAMHPPGSCRFAGSASDDAAQSSPFRALAELKRDRKR